MEKKLNTWAIQNNKDDIDKALKYVVKDSASNVLYLNCRCKFRIGNYRVLNRTFDACFCSEDSNTIVLFARGLVSETEIEKHLKDNGVEYTTIRFMDFEEEYKDDSSFPTVVFANEQYILNWVLKECVLNGETECQYLPYKSSALYLNYVGNDGEKHLVLGNLSTGLIKFKNKLVLLPTDPKFHDLEEKEVRKMLTKRGISIKEKTRR